jgi:isoquinoline 1-oxidoreductase alpha subunit
MKLRINNEELDFRAAPETPLLWVIRDHLNMTGTKFGCGKGLCGACTVHADGQPVRSCSIPVSALAGMEITTIEGIAGQDGGAHPVQLAWQELDVPQCGYCQSGQIMSAVALLAENSAPDDAAIDAAMEGNLCRCGTYLKVRAAIKKAATDGGAS